MVALLVSYFLLAYLFAPRVIFRAGAAVFVPLKFQRTRTEELVFALWIALLPLIAAASIDLSLWGWPSAWSYQQVFAASYSEKIFVEDQALFWTALRNLLWRQMEFLALYYSLILAETVVFVVLIRKHGNWRSKCRPYEWFVQQVLLRTVSEWHVLLTLFNFPDVPKRKVAADVLAEDDHLYQGDLVQYFSDTDGALSGLFLENARRFDRPRYLADKAKGETVRSKAYWREIPSSVLYIPREKLLNLNLRYPPIEPSGMETAKTATQELRKEGIDLKIEIPNEDSVDLKEETRPGSRESGPIQSE